VKDNALKRTVASWIVGLGMLNFVIYVAIAFYLGGDAVNGKREDGHYYLFGTRTVGGQKVYTEVSESVYNFSRVYTFALMGSWPFVMGAAFVRNRIKK
jgi:hypothetical protein